MKTLVSIVSFLIIGSLFSAQAQPVDKYGTDKAACGRNYTIYYEYYKLGNYSEAIPFWQKTIEICPGFSVGVWKNGEKMYKAQIEKNQNPDRKEQLIDSLLWIYDQRIKYFGHDSRSSQGYVLGRKGLTLLTYRKAEAKQAYDYLSESIALEGSQTQADVALSFMQVSRHLYQEGIIDANGVLNDYETSMKVIEANLSANPNDKLFTRAAEGVEAHFTKSGAADCNSLTAIYQPQLATNLLNQEWLDKVHRQLRSSGCKEGDLYLDIEKALFELAPTGEAAHDIAKMYMGREEFDQAKLYLQKALDLNLPDGEKAQAWYELSIIQFSQEKDYSEARSSARNALALRPNWGEPHLLIGKIYIDARKSAFTEEFDQNTVFWAAIDQFDQAQKLDPEVAEKAKELIQLYSKYFPSSETMFYYGLKDGQDYAVGSWINEKTRAIARK